MTLVPSSLLDSLNDRYAIAGHVSFQPGEGGLITALVENEYASGSMTLAGGHVMAFTPHGQPPVLWVSPTSASEIGHAMRGGVPVCWPWFANHPTEPGLKPLHGFARTALWTVRATQALPDGSTQVSLALRDDAQTRALWPYAFEIGVTAAFGRSLKIEWAVRNTGAEAFTYTGALHSYFQVSDTAQVAVRGLEGCEYLDKPRGFERFTQVGPITFPDEVNRIYLDTTGPVTLEDPGLGRTIRIRKFGSRTTVVWNPYDQDADMPDVGAGEHNHFVCIETTNAADDRVTVLPGDVGCLGMEVVCA